MPLTEEQEIALLENVASVTSHMRMVDEVFKANKLGRNMVPAFQCGHSGLFFRGDFVREWGRLYGIGQGPNPVSEVLDTDYETAPPPVTPQIKRLEQIMHPVGPCFAQVDFTLVDVDAVEWAITAEEDPDMERRAAIVREKQLKNPRGRLRNMAAAFAAAGRR